MHYQVGLLPAAPVFFAHQLRKPRKNKEALPAPTIEVVTERAPSNMIGATHFDPI